MRWYYIWSHEHQAWWRPAHHGYTNNIAEAGKYTRDETADITLDLIPAGEDVAVPVENVEACIQKNVDVLTYVWRARER